MIIAQRFIAGYTIAEILKVSPSKSYDVGEFAIYDVKVSFLGKSRKYRALALFHNLYGSTQNPAPFFWDNVVGLGGVLTDVLNEKRPLLGQKEEFANPQSIRNNLNSPGHYRPRILPANWESPELTVPDFDTDPDESTDTDTSPKYSSGPRHEDHLGRWAWDVFLLSTGLPTN